MNVMNYANIKQCTATMKFKLIL